MAWAAPAAFVALAVTLVAVGAVAVVDAVVAAVAVLLAYGPSGWIAPGGWPRRSAEVALLPCGYVLTMVSDATMVRMALPPLLVLAALAAALAAVDRGEASRRPLVIASLALAIRVACGLGLAGVPWWAALASLAAPPALAWAATRRSGAPLGIVVALLAGAAPLQHRPWLALALTMAALALGRVKRRFPATRAAHAWLPGAAAVALAAAAIAAWGGLPLARALPVAGWTALAAVAAALLLTPMLPRGVAAAAWLAITPLFGPLQPAPTDVAGFALEPEHGVTLPEATGGRYLVELSLSNAAQVPQETVVAQVRVGDTTVGLRAGLDTAEWAHERADVRASAAHTLPIRPVWRPLGYGSQALWAVAGRTVAPVPAGAQPTITRAAGLDPRVGVSVLGAGPSRPTPPRDWTLGAWLLATSVAVALLQLLAGTWRRASAWVPWALLAGASLAARMPAEPLRLLLERHAVDVVLAALLAAWLPPALSWLARQRVFLAAATLLVPLAIATPHLTPPMYGDEPFHLIVLDSLANDHDLDLADNYDLEHHPYNHIYVTGNIFLHSPVLAVALLPGYLVAGRTGALVLLALAGSATVVFVLRRARQLGVPGRRLAIVALLLLTTYPLATFSTQIWVEIVGALAAAAGLVWVVATPPGRLRTLVATVVATAIKTRLALVTFPVALAAWWPRRSTRRNVLLAVLALLVAASLGLAAGWAFLGHPLGYRRLADLVPHDIRQPFLGGGGLLFDASGGLALANPLALVAILALPWLWRRGGPGERLVILGGVATFVALLHSIEWYGGGAPPARYLVPLLPVAALAGALLLARPDARRRLVVPLVPLAVTVWWGLVTRPQWSINPGDGGWWLSAALARRFAAAARHLFPSFLVPRPASFVWVVALVALSLLSVLAARRWPLVVRRGVRLTVAGWLLLGAGTVVAVTQRHDSVVEIEEPQVVRRGGSPVPPTGTYSRFLHPNGWRLDDGAEVIVPLNLPPHAAVTLSGWIDDPAGDAATLSVAWDDAPPQRFPVSRPAAGTLPLPPPPGPGRHRLHLSLRSGGSASAVLDRVEVRP